MNDFIQKVKSEVKLPLTDHREHLKYLGMKDEIMYKDDLKRLFIFNGYIMDPEKSYLIEYSLETEEEKNKVLKEMEYFSINAKVKKRLNRYIVYSKNSEDISTLLSVMGATQSFFYFEDVRIRKSVSSNENRKVNFEVSNINKCIKTGLDQKELIQTLYNLYDEKDIPKDIKEFCDIRLKNLDKNYSELALLFGNITKSGINHKIRKIKSMILEKENNK